MPIFTMLVGLPGAGKDFIVSKYFSKATHISSDAIREEVFGDVNDQSHNHEVFDIMRKRTIAALRNGEDVVYNATNICAKRRIGLLNAISIVPEVERVCWLVIPPVEIVEKQNREREKSVPDDVIKRMLWQFEVPHKSEGWDTIWVYNTKYSNYCHELMFDAKTMPHDNPHHSETIGKHMESAYRYLLEHHPNVSFALKEAAALHDIGKVFTKTFTDARGRVSKSAHYYHHANVGAYLYLSNSWGTQADLYIANLIQWHMIYFNGPVYVKKFKARFGEGFMEELNMLHEADVFSH